MMTDRLLAIRLTLDTAVICGILQGGEEKNEND